MMYAWAKAVFVLEEASHPLEIRREGGCVWEGRFSVIWGEVLEKRRTNVKGKTKTLVLWLVLSVG